MVGGLHVADIAMILLYLDGVGGIGYWASKRVKSLEEFVIPRNFGRLAMIMFSFGSGTHSDQAVSVASKSYTSGVSGIWYQWLWLFATPFYWLIAPVMRRFRAITTSDIYEARFDRRFAVVYTLIAGSGLFTQHFYKQVFPNKSVSHYVMVVRGAALVVVGLGLIMAYVLPNVIVGLEVFWKIASMMGIAFWLGLFWRRYTVVGAWASTLTAFGLWYLPASIQSGECERLLFQGEGFFAS